MIEKGKCPICGKNNGCAFMTGADPKSCWCMTTKVPKDLLSNIPDEHRNISCICRSCVQNYEKKVCVVGSLNVDHVLNVQSFPAPGETIKAKSLHKFYGGKGGNQATACNLLGMTTAMLGSIGSDALGQEYINHLNKSGIQTDLVYRAGEFSGQAFIQVDSQGENQIVTIGGANYDLTKTWIDQNMASILDYDVFMFSLEIPQAVVLYLMEILRNHHKLIILDPAPFSNFDIKMLDYVDYITPNNTEYQQIKPYIKSDHQVVLKKGSRGSSFLHNNLRINIPPYQVDVVDTVGAGDTFNSALCFGLMFNYSIEETLMLANTAGALATTKQGAQSGMPTLKELLRLKHK